MRAKVTMRKVSISIWDFIMWNVTNNSRERAITRATPQHIITTIVAKDGYTTFMLPNFELAKMMTTIADNLRVPKVVTCNQINTSAHV
jgi:hypothetical protein